MKFHLGDILSITTGKLVSPRHMNGVYEILNFMTRDNLFMHQLPRASRICGPELKRQLPQLDTPEMDFAVAKLDEMLKTPSGTREPGILVSVWLDIMIAKYGETFEVSPLEPGQFESKNPLTELSEMMGPEKIMVVTTG